MQEYLSAGVQGCRGAGVQGCRSGEWEGVARSGSLAPEVEQDYSILLAGVTDIVPTAVSARITAA